MLEHLIELILPPIIALCELIGIIVVSISAAEAFYKYIKSLFTHQFTNFKFELAQGLATALEFKMAAEILKTLQVENLTDLIILGAVILLRALLSILIHVEMKGEDTHQELKAKYKLRHGRIVKDEKTEG